MDKSEDSNKLKDFLQTCFRDNLANVVKVRVEWLELLQELSAELKTTTFLNIALLLSFALDTNVTIQEMDEDT